LNELLESREDLLIVDELGDVSFSKEGIVALIVV
jgi:hypothetical protein